MSNEDTENPTEKPTPKLPRALAVVVLDEGVYRISQVQHDIVDIEQLHKDLLGGTSWQRAHVTDEVRIEILERALMARE